MRRFRRRSVRFVRSLLILALALSVQRSLALRHMRQHRFALPGVAPPPPPPTAWPTPPEIFSTAYTEPTTVVTIIDTGNAVTNMALLQSAVDSGTSSKLVEASGGITFQGQILPPLQGSRPLGAKVVVSPAAVNWATFPDRGTRARPSTAEKAVPGAFTVGIGNYINFRPTSVNQPCVKSRDNSIDLVIRGGTFNRGATTTQTNLVDLNSPTTSSVSATASHVWFHHCYVWEHPFIGGTRFGFLYGGRYMALEDSWVEGIYENGSETKGVGGYFGPGPWKCINNFIEGVSINVLIGGTVPPNASVNPQDFEFRRNWCFARDDWNVNDPASIRARGKRCTMSGISGTFTTGEALTLSGGITGAVLTAYQGTLFIITVPQGSAYPAAASTITGVTSGETATIQSIANFSTARKNCFEFKNCQRALVTGNLFEGNWSDGQTGLGVVFKSENSAGKTYGWTVVTQDIDFKYNWLHHSCGVLQFSGKASSALESQIYVATNRFKLSHLACTDIGNALLGPAGSRRGLQLSPQQGFDWEISHSGWDAPYNLILYSSTSDGTGFILKDNIAFRGSFGIHGDGSQSASEGLSALNQYTPGHVTLNNLFVACPSGTYPVSNSYPTNSAAVQFVDYTNGKAGIDLNGLKLAGASPYKNTATDGTDPGPDITQILIETAGCRTGVWA